MNPILKDNFSWLYERIRAGLQQLLGRPVSYGPEEALPGFHIFLYEGADQSWDRPATRAHFDMQWMHAIASPHPDETLSFTLTVAEPTGGCSLEIWPVHQRAVHPQTDVLAWAVNHPSQTLWYSRGQMVVHDGLLLHAIGRSSVANPEGCRMTLQGHGARISGEWTLYW
jgi:hypothetical protein